MQTLAQFVWLINTQTPLFIAHPKDAPHLYRTWADATSVAQVRQKLESVFDSNPEQLDNFLACYVGEAWGMESGLPSPADFAREQYNSVTYLISGEYVAANLRLRFGEELASPQFHPSDTMAQSRRVAHQFMAVHQYVLQAQSAASVPATGNELD